MMEKGMLKISDEMLKKIADELKFPLEFFYLQENKTPISDFFYRKRLSLLAGAKLKLEAEIDILRLAYKRLLDSVEIPEARFPHATVNVNFTPKDIALLAREFYKIPKGSPIKNLVEIVEKNGIAVMFLDSAPAKFDGMTVYTDSNHPLIIVNKEISNDRKRFTIAHELGHQIMHIPFRYEFDIYERLKKSPNIFEHEADQFAAEFLMPAENCINELKNLTYGKLGLLKMYWHVSKRAIVYRAYSLGCIDAKKYKTLMIELSRQGERVNEGVDIGIDEPKIMRQIFKAYRENFNFSTQDLSKYLNLNEEDVSKLVGYGHTNKLRIAV